LTTYSNITEYSYKLTQVQYLSAWFTRDKLS
jgi:hypothetical protein